MKMKNLLGAALTSAVLGAAAIGASTPASAAALGVDITANGPNGFALTNPPFTIGWSFDVVSTVSVSALGVWDEGSNGLNQAHDVGLWTAGGALLATTTVPGGLGADAAIASALGLGQWLFENIATITLGPGSYVIGSVSGNDDFRTFQGSIALDPALANFNSGKFNSGGSLAFPGSDEGSDFSLFGPNILIAAVPLPTTLLLSLIGLAGLFVVRIHGRNRA